MGGAAATVGGVGTDGKNSLFNKAIIIYNWRNRNHLLNTSGQPTQIIAIHLNTIALPFAFPFAFSFVALVLLVVVAVVIFAVHVNRG